MAYADLKRRLVAEHAGNTRAYVAGKDVFVKEAERLALEWRTTRA